MKLSVVIPAYNEESRLARTLSSLVTHLEQVLKDIYEIVIVDDGSTDGTTGIVRDFAQKYPMVRLVSYGENRGRGVAVKTGIQAAKGDFILETDADGSVREDAIFRFVTFLDEHPDVDVVIGSRNAKGAEILTAQPILRVVFGWVFLILARIVFEWAITDFTLGFKLFRRRAALDIFEHQKEKQYVAEAEIVVIARRRGWFLRELPVAWTDYRNSRVRILRASYDSLLGLLRIYMRSYK